MLSEIGTRGPPGFRCGGVGDGSGSQSWCPGGGEDGPRSWEKKALGCRRWCRGRTSVETGIGSRAGCFWGIYGSPATGTEMERWDCRSLEKIKQEMTYGRRVWGIAGPCHLRKRKT